MEDHRFLEREICQFTAEQIVHYKDNKHTTIQNKDLLIKRYDRKFFLHRTGPLMYIISILETVFETIGELCNKICMNPQDHIIFRMLNDFLWKLNLPNLFKSNSEISLVLVICLCYLSVLLNHFFLENSEQVLDHTLDKLEYMNFPRMNTIIEEVKLEKKIDRQNII